MSLLKPIELAINTAIAQDLQSKAKLEQFEQRCIAINISDFNKTIPVLFRQQKIQLTNELEQSADLTISGKALTLAKLGSDPESLFSADIDIHGDVQFAKQLRDLLDGFDFDWEAQLAKVTGDALSYPIAHTIRQFGNWARNSHHSLQQNAAEYLKEEIRILPDKSLINDYMAEIDRLRANSDRLEARIQRLQS